MTTKTVEVYQDGVLIETRTETVSDELANEDTIRMNVAQALDSMRAHVARGTFTVVQRDAALILVLRVCIALVRLRLNRLDATD